MADDLDNELLGLVSDGEESEDSGDDFGRLEADVEGRSPSPNAEPHQSVEKVDDAPERRKGVAQKVKARRGKRKARRESEDELDPA